MDGSSGSEWRDTLRGKQKGGGSSAPPFIYKKGVCRSEDRKEEL